MILSFNSLQVESKVQQEVPFSEILAKFQFLIGRVKRKNTGGD